MKKKILTCATYNTNLKMPLCCKRPMKGETGVLMCSLCNSKQEIPLCCENVMINAEH